MKGTHRFDGVNKTVGAFVRSIQEGTFVSNFQGAGPCRLSVSTGRGESYKSFTGTNDGLESYKW